jgi:tryptophan 2,3-dioxygenase
MASPEAVGVRVAPNYGDYLHLDDLLALQQPLASPPAHDELMFIVVHQVYELWFRLLLHELTAARDAMLSGEVHRPRLLLERCHVIERQMLNQFDLLDTLSPLAFLRVRARLSRASGFQSTQFRDIESLSDGRDTRGLAGLRGLDIAGQLALLRRLRQPSMWDGFLAVLAAAGFPVALRASRRETLLTIAHNEEHHDLWQLAEGLVDHDQAWSLWRGRHALMVERQIGAKTGTGGSTGVSYLRSREHCRFFPELWEVRSQL